MLSEDGVASQKALYYQVSRGATVTGVEVVACGPGPQAANGSGPQLTSRDNNVGQSWRP